MTWLKFGLFGSIVFALYYFQQIKMALKGRGYDVSLATGWISDYRRFKRLLADETETQKKIEYQGILNGLHLALVGLAVISVLLFSGE